MVLSLGRSSRIGLVIALVWLAAPATRAGRVVPPVSTRSTNPCYCHCNTKESKRNCPHMCDLRKYGGRLGGGSCHKPSQTGSQNAPERPEPYKYNGTENARQ